MIKKPTTLDLLCHPRILFSMKLPFCERSVALDKMINEYLDAGHEAKIFSPYTIEVNGLEIWTSNKFYYYGNVIVQTPPNSTIALPFKKTQLRLYWAELKALTEMQDENIYDSTK